MRTTVVEPKADGLGGMLFKASAAIMTTNANITAELARLHVELGRLAAIQLSADAGTTIFDLPATSRISATGDGSGAGSLEDYQEMQKTNWHGRLGRTYMVEVDKMCHSAREELDIYLRRTIKAMLPVDGNYTCVVPDMIFGTLSTFGLRLEDRGQLADVDIFMDKDNLGKPTLTRLRNWSACYHRGSAAYGDYWKASATETLIELARYRGLFGADGFLKSV